MFLSPQAEGIEKSYSQSVLLDLTDNKVQTTMKTLNFSFPPDMVNGSERVWVTAIGKGSVCHHILADLHVKIHFSSIYRCIVLLSPLKLWKVLVGINCCNVD